MRKEILQDSRIIIAAKYALKENKKIKYKPLTLESSLSFTLSEKKTVNIKKWYSDCLKKGLKDINLSINSSSSSGSEIVCFYDNKTEYLTSQWSLDPNKRKHIITYTENSAENHFVKKLEYQNNSAAFKAVLEQMRDFAETIGCKDFAEIFQESVDILNGRKIFGSKNDKNRLTNSELAFYYKCLPNENKKLLQAAINSDVFGAMMSWNDTPPCAAHQMGLDKEYDEMSQRLLKEIIAAHLYAINEW